MIKDVAEMVERVSPNIVTEQIEQLKSIFPEAFTEGKIDFDQLKAALGDIVDTQPEKYSFTWAGKRNAIQLLQTPSSATLVPDEDESIDFDTTQNLFMEGDNLEVLKLLYKSYAGRVKMIYIDPPYNTGNDFVYPDDFVDPLDTYLKITGQKDANGNLLTSNPETNGRYHSTWLSMMYPRLYLARQLLREDGVIFVSIDDHELANLRLLMNEVFGEENFAGQIAVQLNPRGRHLDRFLAQTHEYVVIYVRDFAQPSMYELSKDERMAGEYNKSDQLGNYRELELRNRNPAFNKRTRPNLYYPIYVNPQTNRVSLDQDGEYTVEVYPKNSLGQDSCWTWGRDKFKKDQHLLVGRQMKDGSWRIFRKDYFIREDGQAATTLPKSLWLDKEINNDYGKKALQELFDGQTVFDFPKSPYLISKLIQIGAGKDDIILDFFAGSATTAQSVLELNHEDGGNRSFICVQLPEPMSEDSMLQGLGYRTLAEVARERIKRVIKNINEKAVGKLGFTERDKPEDLGFRVFKLAPSNYKVWRSIEAGDPEAYAKQLALFTDPLVENWTPENVLWEVAIKEGYGLNARIKPLEELQENTVWRMADPDKDQSLLLCLDDELRQSTLLALPLTREQIFVCRNKALDDTKAANLALQCRLKKI